MPIPLDEFVKRRRAEAEDADRRARAQPGLVNNDAVQAQLDALGLEAVSGGKDVDLHLAQLLSQIPEDKRDEAVATFRARVQSMEQEKAVPALPQQMTPEQEQMLRQMNEHEQGVIAHLLHEKTREKIRRMFLLNPSLWGQVRSIGEELHKRGLIGQPQRGQAAELGQVAVQPAQTPDKKKDQERER
jgi:DNA-binding TFAR19-related protein (PDSD5 family)